MEALDSVTLTPVDESHSILRIEQHAQEWRVPGVVLEHCHILKDGRHLLFTTDNCPYEEVLHLLLITIGHQTYELIHISQPNTPGVFKDMACIADSCIEFSFIGETRFRATLSDSSTRALSALFSPLYIQYATPLSRKSLSISRLMS